MNYCLNIGTCIVEVWENELKDPKWQASINKHSETGKTYKIDDFWNGIGKKVNGATSASIIGEQCMAEFQNEKGEALCILETGDYKKAEFIEKCGNNKATQYTMKGIKLN